MIFFVFFVPKGPINNIPALIQIMAWCWPGNKQLSEPIIAYYVLVYQNKRIRISVIKSLFEQQTITDNVHEVNPSLHYGSTLVRAALAISRQVGYN